MRPSGEPTRHAPVLRDAVVRAVAPQRQRAGSEPLWWLDGTLGGGGHAAALLEHLADEPRARLLGIDRDPAALARAGRRLADHADRLRLVHGSFDQLEGIAEREGIEDFQGIVLDLGYSSDQLEDPQRGFSFQWSGPLDMRLDPQGSLTAAELVNSYDEPELADLLWRFGEEPASRRIARAIVAARPLRSTAELAEIVADAAPARRRGGKRRHPATRTFQALRIAVNDELGALERALPAAIAGLAPGGRLAVISFHSLEDRIVKHALRDAASGCSCPKELPVCMCEPRPTLRLIDKRPIQPDESEIAANPRARSARLRVAERLASPGARGAA